MDSNVGRRSATGVPVREALSSRELEVLEMTSAGCTNNEVAKRLNLTVHAVKFRLRSVYRKLGVANRTEAAVVYLMSTQSSRNGEERQ